MAHIRIKVFAIVRSFIKINLHSVWASFGLSYGGCKIPQKVTIVKFASCVDLLPAWVNSASFCICFKCFNTLSSFTFQGVSIGPFCSVGPSAKLGNACQLYPGSHVLGNTDLGDNCVLMMLVKILVYLFFFIYNL